MKKLTKILLGLLALLFIGLGLYFYLDERNFYDQGTEKIVVSIGDDFTIKIGLNPSTGYQNCWTNKSKCLYVKETDKQYKSGLFSSNCEGCGGTESWTFQATAQGTDTIKIEACPPLGRGKDCNFFAGDSLRQRLGDSIVSTYAPYRRVDYTFIVTVVD